MNHYYFNAKSRKPKGNAKLMKKTPWKEWLSRGTFWRAIDEYCNEGSLHGLKYLRNPELSRVERIFWLAIFCISVYSCGIVTSGTYIYMADNQVAMSFNPISTPIWDIPFPTVTICSSHPVRKSFFDIENPKNQSIFMYFSKLVCPQKEIFGPKIYNITFDEDFFNFVHKAAIPCKQLFKTCMWNDRERDCCSIFKPVLSKSGQCYTFNGYPGQLLFRNYTPPVGDKDKFNERAKFWQITTGYPSRSGNLWKTVLPLWSENKGDQYGLSVTLNVNSEEFQESCSGEESAFTVHIFPPLETGESGSEIRLINGKLTNINLYPLLLLSLENLRFTPVEQRACLFHDEGNLKHFKSWSQSNCLTECFITNIMNRCGCVPFDLRRVVDAFDYNYCTDGHMPCLFQTLEVMSLLNEPTGSFTMCECLPSCTTLDFEIKSRNQPIVTKDTKPSWAEGFNKSQEKHITQVSVFFAQDQFSQMSRVNTASFSNFMGIVGGLLGLFLGFSFMSGFEIVYFALVKPIVKVITFYCKKNRVNSY